MKNQYSFLEFNKAMWHRLNTARIFECAINFLTKIQADKNRYPIRVHLLTIDRFKNKSKRPCCIKDENGPLSSQKHGEMGSEIVNPNGFLFDPKKINFILEVLWDYMPYCTDYRSFFKCDH